MSFPLNNNTNTIRQPPNARIKPDIHLARLSHNLREQEIQQKLKQTSISPNPAATKNVHHDDFPKLPATEIAARKKKFASYKFFLDNMDPLVRKRIERGIKLMGATHLQFFSKDCTHLITTKTIPIHENLLAPTINSTTTASTTKPTTNSKKYDSIVENAIQFNAVLWSADVMQKTVEFLMNVSSRKEVQEKRALGKVLQEEKLFGPSTGTNSEAQSRRPQFMPFTGHFLIIEDASQAHRPPICKQWTKNLYTKKPAEYPWPYFKQTPKFRSPFGKRVPPPKKPAAKATAADAADAAVSAAAPAADAPAATTADNNNNNTKDSQPVQDISPEDKENMPLLHKQITSAIAAGVKNLTSPSTSSLLSSEKSQTQQQQETTNNAIQKQPDSQNFSMRASGFHPSCTNNIQSASTRSVSTSVSILQGENRRLPPGDSVSRLDKRMVENVTANEQQKLHKQKAQEEQQARREREMKKKRDARYCENCNVIFEKQQDHVKQQTHQTFIRDQNNFKDLDVLISTSVRPYKLLPDHMRGLIDPSVDGKNIEFASDRKRTHPPTPSLDGSSPTRKLTTANMMKKKSITTSQPRIASNETDVNDNEGWGKYGDVFL